MMKELSAVLSKTLNFERLRWIGHFSRSEEIKNTYKMQARETSRNTSTCNVRVKMGS
jgi:hypothetical protein